MSDAAPDTMSDTSFVSDTDFTKDPLTISICGIYGAAPWEEMDLLDLLPKAWPLERDFGTYEYSESSDSVHYLHKLSNLRPNDVDFMRNATASDEDIIKSIVTDCRLNVKFTRTNRQPFMAYDERVDCTSNRWINSPHKEVTLGDTGRTFTLPGYIMKNSGLMVKAKCIACMAVRRNIPVGEAIQFVEDVLTRNNLSFPTESIRILLRWDASLEERVELYLEDDDFDTDSDDSDSDGSDECESTGNERESNETDRPWLLEDLDDRSKEGRMRRVVELVLDEQVKQGVYSAVILRSPEDPPIDTMAKVAKALEGLTASPSPSPSLWRPLMGNIKVCVAYTGMPLSGKTALSRITAKHLGYEGAHVSYSYFEKMANWKCGIGIIHELDRYALWHPWLEVLVLDVDGISCSRMITEIRESIGDWNDGSLTTKDGVGADKNSTITNCAEITDNAAELALQDKPDPSLSSVPSVSSVDTISKGEQVTTPSKAEQTKSCIQSSQVKLLLVHVDTSLDNRRSRTEAENKQFDPAKDQQELNKDSEEIKALADVLVDNNASLKDAFSSVRQVLEAYLD